MRFKRPATGGASRRSRALALALARDVRVEDPSMAGAILSTLGNAHESLGDFSQAIAYHTQHLAIAKAVGDRAGRAGRTETSRTRTSRWGTFPRRSIDYHTQHLAIAKEVGDRAGEGRAYGGLRIAHRSLGDFFQAIEYHTQRLAIAREVGDRVGEGKAGNILGVALEMNGNLPAAAHALMQDLASFQGVECDLGAYDHRVSLFEQQHAPTWCCRACCWGSSSRGGRWAWWRRPRDERCCTTSRQAALGTTTRPGPRLHGRH